MKLSLITINYNGSSDTIKLLESLRVNDDQDFEIIVVDNASDQVDIDKIQYWIEVNYPKAKIIRSPQNTGFAGGNNIGLSEAFRNALDWAVLLNNDTWSDSHYIASLKAVLEAKTGIIGLPLQEGSRIAYGGRVEWLKETLKHTYEPISHNIQNTTYAIGAHIAISREAYEKIGGLDEKYFLYFEDADYTLTALRKGVKVGFEINPKLNHKISSTTSALGSPLLLRYHYRNSLYFNDKHGDKLLTSIWATYVFIKQIIKIILRKNPDHSKAILNGVLDYWLSRMGKIELN